MGASKWEKISKGCPSLQLRYDLEFMCKAAWRERWRSQCQGRRTMGISQQPWALTLTPTWFRVINLFPKLSSLIHTIGYLLFCLRPLLTLKFHDSSFLHPWFSLDLAWYPSLTLARLPVSWTEIWHNQHLQSTHDVQSTVRSINSCDLCPPPQREAKKISRNVQKWQK